jgi:hypothetical protein
MTHHRPHLDEIMAFAILQQCGKEKYPGVDTAEYVFCDAGSETPDGRSWKKWHEEGILLIGVGGSCFDEHPTPTKDRKENDCAATLVARHLGIESEPWMTKLLHYTKTNDTKGGTNPFDLAAMVNRLMKQFYDKSPSQTIEACIHNMILPYLVEQMNFFFETAPEFDQKAKVIKSSHRGRDIVIVAIESDNLQVGAYARSKYGADADVVIQRNSKGNVAITTKSTSMINLNGAIIGLRSMEMRLKDLPRNENINLIADGTIQNSGCEEWYYASPARQILNGSSSAPNVSATKIKFEKLISIVKDRLAQTFDKPTSAVNVRK